MQPLPLIEPRTFKSCGECTACCTALSVHEIDKGEFAQCEHDCGTHCGIYQKRPESCKGYQCLWTAMEGVGDEFRPDRLGIIIEIQQSTIGPAVTVREMEVGIMDDQDSLAYQFAMIVAKGVGGFVMIFRPGEQRRSIFPPWAAHLADKARMIVQNHRGSQKPVVIREVHSFPEDRPATVAKVPQKKQRDKDKEKRKKRLAAKQKRRNRK